MMEWPQIILISIVFLNLGVRAAKHGEPRGDHNVGVAIIDVALLFSLLWWGGFFN